MNDNIKDVRCKTCRHVDRDKIEAERRSGVSIRRVSEKYHVSAQSIFNHEKKHLVEPENEVDELTQEINEMTEEIEAAKKRGDHLAAGRLVLKRSELRKEKRLADMDEGNSLEARVRAVVADKELFRKLLDETLNTASTIVTAQRKGYA